MAGKLVFEPIDGNGRFRFPSKIDSELCGKLEDLSDAAIDRAGYENGLTAIIRQEPEFLDARVYLASYHLELGQFSVAQQIASLGMAIATSLIPADFKKRIDWLELGNRPFLRLLAIATLANVHMKHHKEAIRLIKMSLKFNPNDNLGLRVMLGSEQLRAGQEMAKKSLAKHTDMFPSCHYELALAYIQDGDWAAAATALRKGFCDNLYIAEMLCGMEITTPLRLWHGTNHAEPGYAADYIGQYGDLWDEQPESKRFVRWLFNHSSVLRERADMLACREELHWTEKLGQRSNILDRLRALMAGVDDHLSRELVRKRTDRFGVEHYPWQ